MKLTQELNEFLIEDIVEDVQLVENELFHHLQSDPPLLGEIANSLIRAGGKRVRPALVLLGFKAAGGGDINTVVPIAAAIELIHTASLIHDDINDGSKMRRGIPTCNRKYGNTNALVAGDFLFVKAFKIGGMYDWEIVKIIADACSQLAEGEIMQDSNRFNTELSMEDYLITIEKKTASLIEACVKVGAVLSGTSDENVKALSNYAYNIGMAFQITDDILDVKGNSEDTGKPRGNDIREGQLSIVAIKALQAVNEANRGILEDIIRKKENTDEEIQTALNIIMETDALASSYLIGKEYTDKARTELMKLPETDYRDNLELLIEMIIQRYY